MNEYKTSNFNLASTLHSQGFSCVKFKKDDQGRFTFIFQESPEMDDALELYWQGSMMVNVRSLDASRKFFREMIHSN